jgi:cytidine deaminase
MAVRKSFEINYLLYESSNLLTDVERDLVERARSASINAYAPYSGFKVGACVLLDDGTFISGNNQENAAYPSGMCAERVALFSASSQNPGTAVRAIAISAFSEKFEVNHPVSPCGACRQVIAEYEFLHRHKIKVLLTSTNGEVLVFEGIETLLPLLFSTDFEKLKSVRK